MIVKKSLSFKSILKFTWHHLLWLTCWMTAVSCIQYFTGWKMGVMPWVALPLIGTAVAFYVGFKNNQSYDRLWEARKIWSEVTNDSRKLAAMLRHYRSEEPNSSFGTKPRRVMLFNHIAYLYQLREQLLEPTIWEHVSLTGFWGIGYFNRQRRDNLNAAFKSELDEVGHRDYLSPEEKIRLKTYDNKAIQLLTMQLQAVQRLLEKKQINIMQQLEIQNIICNFFDAQGRMERIKQTPFPRKYATFSFIFVCIFVFLLPFGVIGEFTKYGDFGIWLSIPINVTIGWIYVTMEMIGDYSENPFEGLHNDTPMLSICRMIEIDMLQTFGEAHVPAPIEAKGEFLI